MFNNEWNFQSNDPNQDYEIFILTISISTILYYD